MVGDPHRELASAACGLHDGFLEAGLILKFFSEPEPVSGLEVHQDRARRVPWFVVMEWQRPA